MSFTTFIESKKKPTLTDPARPGVIGTMAINYDYNKALSDMASSAPQLLAEVLKIVGDRYIPSPEIMETDALGILEEGKWRGINKERDRLRTALTEYFTPNATKQ